MRRFALISIGTALFVWVILGAAAIYVLGDNSSADVPPIEEVQP